MIRLQKAAFWFAALCGLAAAIYLGDFLWSRTTDDALLFKAALAVGCSAASLLLGVLLACNQSTERFLLSLREVLSPARADGDANAFLLEQYRYRQDVIGERLNIDEVRLCTQTQAPCAAWSFCGPEPADAAGAAGDGGAGKPGMPIIERSCRPVSCMAMPVGEKADDASPAQGGQPGASV